MFNFFKVPYSLIKVIHVKNKEKLIYNVENSELQM